MTFASLCLVSTVGKNTLEIGRKFNTCAALHAYSACLEITKKSAIMVTTHTFFVKSISRKFREIDFTKKVNLLRVLSVGKVFHQIG